MRCYVGIENIRHLLYPESQVSWLRHPSLYCLFSKGVETNQAGSQSVEPVVNI